MCFVISCLLSLVCHSQLQYDQLEGIWKFTKGEFKWGKDVIDTNQQLEYIVFESNGNYHRYAGYFRHDSVHGNDTNYNIEKGKWKLNKKNNTILITEKYWSNYGRWERSVSFDYADSLLMVDGKNLVFLDLEKITMHYQRAYKVPAYLVSKTYTIPGEKYAATRFNHHKEYRLRRKKMPPLKLYRKDSTKVVLARNGESVSLYLQRNDTCKDCPCNYDYLSGSVDSAVADTFYMDVDQRMYNYRDIFGNTYTNTIDYSWFSDADSTELSSPNMSRFQAIPLSKIYSVYYNSPSRTKAYGISETFMGISAFTALIVSPLVSINYRKGTFNSRRYFSWAGLSLVGFGASLTVNLLTGEREYKVVGY